MSRSPQDVEGTLDVHSESSVNDDLENHRNYPEQDLSWLQDGYFSHTLSATTSGERDSSACLRDATIMILHHSVDFLRITAVTQTLFARWLQQLFLELDRYDHAPSLQIQKTWLGYPIVGIAGALSLFAKIGNALSKKEKYLAAQDYLFSLFCSSIVYFFLDLCQGAASLPLGVFLATSAIVLPLAAAFFVNLALPDSDNRFHFSDCSRDTFSEVLDVDNIHVARCLNVFCGANYGFSSITTLLWAINREVHGKTVSLPWWQMSFVGVSVLSAMKIGYDLTEHPTRFQKFVMLSKFFKEGALTYAAFSGIFFMLFHQQACFENKEFRAFLIVLCTSLALGIGLYSAATTRFRFGENIEGINTTISRIRCASTTIKKTGNSVIGFFSNCWKKEQEVDFLQRSDNSPRNLI